MNYKQEHTQKILEYIDANFDGTSRATVPFAAIQGVSEQLLINHLKEMAHDGLLDTRAQKQGSGGTIYFWGLTPAGRQKLEELTRLRPH